MAEDKARARRIAVSPQDHDRVVVNVYLADCKGLGELPYGLRVRGHSLEFFRRETCERA